MRTFPHLRAHEGLLVVPVDFRELRRARRRERVAFWTAFGASLAGSLSFLGGAAALVRGAL